MKSYLKFVAAAVVCLGAPAFAASSVDASLDEIAEQIVQRTQSDTRTTIGISTFTHSDGTCSNLSNYISEFIVDSLFNAGQGKIDIIERSQLSAIFREMELVFDGTIAPDAAKRLGEIEGVDALVTGSLIQFGEEVKLQARLISTENGRLFATAKTSFPSVGSVAKMMAERNRASCGFVVAGGDRQDGSDGPRAGAGAEADAPTPPASGLAASTRRFKTDEFEAEVTRLSVTQKGEANFVLRFRNMAETSIALSYVESSLEVSDQMGRPLNYKANWSGMKGCRDLRYTNYCTGSDPRYATIMAPGEILQLRFTVSGEAQSGDALFTLAMDLVVTPDSSEPEKRRVKRITFFDMTPDR